MKRFKQFKRWMKYHPPYALTLEGWDIFYEEFKKNAPIRYFVVNQLPIPYRWVTWQFHSVKTYIRYRIYRKHVVDTKLQPDYYDTDVRMIHAMFSLMVDFVEVELAYEHDDNIRYNRFVPYCVRRMRYRNPEMGVDSIMCKLNDDSLPDDVIGFNAELLELYNWWVNVRPSRREPEYPDIPPNELMKSSFKKNHPDLHAEYKRISALKAKMSEKWDKEDTKMLIRLIKIRQWMWT